MKSLSCLIVFLTFALPVHSQGQVVKPVNCEVQELAIAAALGDPLAQYNLAVEFHRGEKVAVDLAKSATLWRLASEGGVISAFNNLGHLNYYGRGIHVNRAEGVRLWRIASKKGFPESQVHLANAYSDGKFLPVNYVEAYAWATVGKHNSTLDVEDDPQNEVGKMADEKLAAITPNLAPAQLAAAKRKAALYIRQYPFIP